ncbi:MAG: pyridoxamine 5'-phosphate oxidase family protein [Rhizomicrobium sp.]
MAKFYDQIDDVLANFITRQRMFFSASAVEDGRVNLSPKGMDCLRILGPQRIAYLDLTGSGNETSAHMEAGGRLTLMFCAFDGAPLILRAYGIAQIHRLGSRDYEELLGHFVEHVGARQIVDMQVQSLQTSCGYAVPLMRFEGHRPNLLRWAETKGEDGLKDYRRANNRVSIDGLQTGWD